MGASALLDLNKPRYPFLPVKQSGSAFSDAKQKMMPVFTDPPKGYVIYADEASSRGATENPGLERRELRLKCRVVRSPSGKKLNLPEGVGVGYKFPLTLRGRSGTALIDAAPNRQLKEVLDELGEVFYAVWSFND